jgi:hypothetical protein
VGGFEVHRWDGGAWRLEDVTPGSTLNGVHCGAAEVLVVGNGGVKLRLDRAAGRWIDETLDAPYDTDFHAAWISPAGALWAGGGNFNHPPSAPRFGVLGVSGCPIPR